MLKSQKSQIRDRVLRFQAFVDQEKRKKYMKKFSLKAVNELKKGELHIQKEVNDLLLYRLSGF